MMHFQSTQKPSIKNDCWNLSFQYFPPTLHWVKNNFTFYFSPLSKVLSKSLAKGGGVRPFAPPPVAPMFYWLSVIKKKCERRKEGEGKRSIIGMPCVLVRVAVLVLQAKICTFNPLRIKWMLGILKMFDTTQHMHREASRIRIKSKYEFNRI